MEKSTDKTWLVFKSGISLFALEAKNVKEIIRSSEISKLPFMPPYIKGIIDYCHVLYSVLDFSLFQNNAPTDTNNLILLEGSEGIALQIKEINGFYRKPVLKESSSINSRVSYFFSGYIDIDDKKAAVLNMTKIIKKIKTDLENI